MPGPNKEQIYQIKSEFALATADANDQKLRDREFSRGPRSYLYEIEHNRSGGGYIESLGGLENMLAYIRKLPFPSILDAGAGKQGSGLIELSKTLGKGINVYGIGLNINLDAIPSDLRDHFFCTNFENFKNLKPGTLGGIVSDHGVFEYSKHPELVIRKAHKLLAPGGVIKVFNSIDNAFLPDEERQSKIDLFQFYFNNFKKLGYEIDSIGLKETYERHTGSGALFLAIKPGLNGDPETSAQARDLLWADYYLAGEQLAKHKSIKSGNKE